MNDRMMKLEETIAHMTQVVEDLSDIVARQESEITALNSRMALVMQREAEREVASGGTAPLGDETPPHW